MSRFLTVSYWFTNYKPIASITLNVLAVVFLLTLIAAIAINFHIYVNKPGIKARIYKKWMPLMYTVGIVGLILVFFSSQNIPYLGARWLYVLLVVIAAAWTLKIMKFVKKEFPAHIQNLQEQKNFEKYLPKRKKKR